jgi:NAD(P)-dependent dehydrogenase (short-subunit alcohol dehydrogenase family)
MSAKAAARTPSAAFIRSGPETVTEQQAPTKEGVDQARAQFAAAVPFGRLGRPDEIASAALFLASYEATFIAGVDLPVEGGMTAI